MVARESSAKETIENDEQGRTTETRNTELADRSSTHKSYHGKGTVIRKSMAWLAGKRKSSKRKSDAMIKVLSMKQESLKKEQPTLLKALVTGLLTLSLILALPGITAFRSLIFVWAEMEMKSGVPVAITPLAACLVSLPLWLCAIASKDGRQEASKVLTLKFWPMVFPALLNSLAKVLYYVSLKMGDATAITVVVQCGCAFMIPLEGVVHKVWPRPTQSGVVILVVLCTLLYTVVTMDSVSMSIGAAGMALLSIFCDLCGDFLIEFMTKYIPAASPKQVVAANEFWKIIPTIALCIAFDLEFMKSDMVALLDYRFWTVVAALAFFCASVNYAIAVVGALFVDVALALEPFCVYAVEISLLKPRPVDMAELLVLIILVGIVVLNSAAVFEMRSVHIKAQVELTAALLAERRSSRKRSTAKLEAPRSSVESDRPPTEGAYAEKSCSPGKSPKAPVDATEDDDLCFI